MPSHFPLLPSLLRKYDGKRFSVCQGKPSFSSESASAACCVNGRLRVATLHPSREAAVGGFDVAIAMVNTDDVDSVFVFHSFILSVSKIFAHLFGLAPVRAWIHLTPDSESGPWESHPCASAQLLREVSLSCPNRRCLVGCRPAVEAHGKSLAWDMVMAHGLPALVGENVSDE